MGATVRRQGVPSVIEASGMVRGTGHLGRSRLIEHFRQFRPIRPAPACRLDKHPLAPGSMQSIELQGVILLVGRDPCVADQQSSSPETRESVDQSRQEFQDRIKRESVSNFPAGIRSLFRNSTNHRFREGLVCGDSSERMGGIAGERPTSGWRGRCSCFLDGREDHRPDCPLEVPATADCPERVRPHGQ